MNLRRNSLSKMMGAFLFPLFCVAGLLFTSCEETAEVDEYAHWEERNAAFIQAVAQLAEQNADGKWLKIRSHKLNDTDREGNPVVWDVDDYIYCHIEKEGTGTVCPLLSDSISANYRGRLIPTDLEIEDFVAAIAQGIIPQGEVFDESYKGELNPALNIPKDFSVKGVITGWTTALIHMKEGDHWRVYIPYTLGYEDTDKGNIPAYSTLIFDINLVDVY